MNETAFTVKLIRAMPDAIEADVKTYLDGASPTTIHSISSFQYGAFIYALIVFE